MLHAKEGIYTTSASEIVADAMMRSFWRQLEYPFREMGNSEDVSHGVGSQYLSSTIIDWTANKCRWSSSYALAAIAQHPLGPDVFDYFTLVNAWDYGKYSKERELRHSFFLVRSGDHWYGGSPANITYTKKVPASEVATGSLGAVVSVMTGMPLSHGCYWPDVGYIQSVIDETSAYIPEIERDPKSPYEYRITCMSVNRILTLYEYGIDTISMDFRQMVAHPW